MVHERYLHDIEEAQRQPPKCALCESNQVELPIVMDGRLEKLLGTNDPPNNTDLPTLSASLMEAQILSAKLRDWVSAIEGSLQRLQEARTTIESSILQHQGVLHPIRTVPDDVLLAIFQWCSELAVYDRDATPLVPEDAPWTLARVSRRWRALALSSPRLWSTVNIHPLPLPRDELRRATTWLVLQIRRSQRCDLTILVSGTIADRETGVHNQLLVSCLDLLRLTTDRWRTAELTDVPHALVAMFSGMVFSKLTDLTLMFTETYDTVFNSVRWYTPALIAVRLTEWAVGMIELSWEGVKYYHCGAASFWHIPACITLEELVVPQLEWSFIQMGNISVPFTLPTVHTLNLTDGVGYRSVPQVSDALILPSLNTLRLNFDTSRPFFFPYLQGAVRRVEILSLVSLQVDSGRIETLVAFLRECVSVTTIYIDDGICDEAMLLALTVSDDPDNVVLLPRLTHLGFDPNVITSFPDQVMELVLSRSRSVSKLTELTVLWNPDWEGPWEWNLLKWKPETEAKWTAVYECVRLTKTFGTIFPFDD